ncbi:IS66-like element accessory protein TnpA [Pseudoroseomonas ludipueritiae]|uniref:Transposase n=1 Tax=Pseudoroseomonas ludipueritiae TaxID=198093 RepID=A0ABR7RC05_9PROT|nr:transposase [Pseudoroseomonas ludipueritiae]MBC9179112.1 transposase [Pseudoroseomonas ludipueritiae]
MSRDEAGTDASTGADTGASTRAERIEIVTRGEGRRSYTPEQKVRLVAETLRPGATVQGVSRRHGVCSSLLHRWRREARGEAPQRRVPAPRLLPVRLVSPEVTDAPVPSSRPVDTADPQVEIVLRNGRVLRVGMTADPAAVACLAMALET